MNKPIRPQKLNFSFRLPQAAAGKVSASGDVSEIYQSEDVIMQSHSKPSLSRRGRNWAKGGELTFGRSPPYPTSPSDLKRKPRIHHNCDLASSLSARLT